MKHSKTSKSESQKSKSQSQKSTSKQDTPVYAPQKIEKYKPKKGIFSWDGIKSMWTHVRKYPNRFFLIMHKTNGMIDMSFVYTHQNMFVYKGGMYIIDEDAMKWNDTLQTYVGVYFQQSALPISLAFDVKGTIEAIKDNLQESRVSANVDPFVLHSTVKSEVIQKLMRGEELEKFMRNMFYGLVFAVVGIVGILLILFNTLM